MSHECFRVNGLDSRVLRNINLRTPSGLEGSSGSRTLCVPQGCLTIQSVHPFSW